MIMKTMKRVLAAALMCGSIAFMSCSDSEDDPISQPEGRDDKPKTEYNIFLMSDIHVMAPELLVNEGEAFENYLKSDPKLLEESGEVAVGVVVIAECHALIV